MIQHSSPLLQETDYEAVKEVLDRRMIANGKVVKQFEVNLADYMKASDVVTCGNGTAGFILSLLALGIKKGDEVIMPTYVCEAVALAVLAVGARPVLC